MEKKWSVTDIQGCAEEGIEITQAHHPQISYRFVLNDGKGEPCAEFGYASYVEAEAGRGKILEAFKSVATVRGLR